MAVTLNLAIGGGKIMRLGACPIPCAPNSNTVLNAAVGIVEGVRWQCDTCGAVWMTVVSLNTDGTPDYASGVPMSVTWMQM